MNDDLSFEKFHKQSKALINNLNMSIFGQEDLIIETVSTFLSSGHILITGAPGLAKTTLIKSFASKIGLSFGRIQFTPDLLPTDITGGDILNFESGSQKRFFEFNKGPIFVNLLLADEINRASPRTQSALLEAMQEKSVTNNGKNYDLPLPFMVFATQNPFESEGTFVLPEAQMDRFLLHTKVNYPNKENELKILEEHSKNQLIGEVINSKDKNIALMNQSDVIKLLEYTKKIRISTELLNLINEIVRQTRPENNNTKNFSGGVEYGAGPRAGISLISVCKSFALISGDEAVRWKHIERMTKPVLRHRIKINETALYEGFTEDVYIDQILDNIKNTYEKTIKEL